MGELSPRRAKYELTQALVDATADASRALLVTWANSHHADFALNWVAHARGAGIRNFLVGCLDDELVRILEERCPGAAAHLFRVPDFPSYYSSPSSSSSPSALSSSSTSSSEGEGTGWGTASFHALGRAKVSLARLLVERHGVDVLISDVDAVWLRDPFPSCRGSRRPTSCPPRTRWPRPGTGGEEGRGGEEE